MEKDPMLEAYFNYVKTVNKEVTIRRTMFLLSKVQAVLGKPLFKASTASEITETIRRAVQTRKRADNGGFQDDGQYQSYRMGIEVVCFFRWAYGERLIDRNIYTKNTFRQPPAKESHHLTEENIKTLFQKFEDLNLRDRIIIRFLLDTGLRVSELCRVKIEDIDFVSRQVYVFMTKSDRPKNVVFSEKTKEELGRWLSARPVKSPFLVPNRFGEEITPQSIRLMLSRVGKELGFRTNPHAFRHTMATLWLTYGAQETEIMKQLGHVDRKQIARYAHPSTRHLHGVQDRVLAAVQTV